MRPADVSTPAPSDAERVRSLLHAATSLTATTRAGRHDLMGPHLLDAGAPGRTMRLKAPSGCRLTHEAEQAAADSAEGLPVLLEWTDVAPVAVRARVRGQVRIAGRLGRPEEAGDGTAVMPLEPTRIMLGTDGAQTPVDPQDLARAHPDPIAPFEAVLLTHMADDHHDQVAALTRLLDPRLLVGITRAWPLTLDQYGIVLRLERLRAHHDVRLPFDEPLLDVDHIGHRIHALLASARLQPRRPRLRTDHR
ncbi:DUF2470 domain-containing protein [Kitasatospora sp. NPDC057223]|uniref:DUF2470 domain-containing protein n=1 Tax=Kitasatospora sp. NPDC057223 TaxID=3346055 RepID=UPI00363A6967